MNLNNTSNSVNEEKRGEDNKNSKQEDEGISLLASMGFEKDLIDKAIKRFPNPNQSEQRIDYLLSGAALLEEEKEENILSMNPFTDQNPFRANDDYKESELDLVTDLFGDPLDSSDPNEQNEIPNEINIEEKKEEKIEEEKKFLKRMLPYELQKLFVTLQFINQKSVSTKELTESFGWNERNTGVQQDIHELNRVLFNRLEESLKGTSGENIIKDLYSIITSDELICTKCGYTRKAEEVLHDLVKNYFISFFYFFIFILLFFYIYSFIFFLFFLFFYFLLNFFYYFYICFV